MDFKREIKMNELERKTESLQKSCHLAVTKMINQTNASYQDCTNVWMFTKLAELELIIQDLQSKKGSLEGD